MPRNLTKLKSCLFINTFFFLNGKGTIVVFFALRLGKVSLLFCPLLVPLLSQSMTFVQLYYQTLLFWMKTDVGSFFITNVSLRVIYAKKKLEEGVHKKTIK